MNSKLLLCLCICMIIFTGCRKKCESPVSAAIADKVSKGEGTIINLVELTNFDWDRVYIFYSYQNDDSIQKTVGCQFLEPNEPFFVEEGETFVVFVKNNKVVHYFNYPRDIGDFAERGDYAWFTPQNAKFQVVHEGYGMYGGKWLTLKAVECNSVERKKD